VNRAGTSVNTVGFGGGVNSTGLLLGLYEREQEHERFAGYEWGNIMEMYPLQVSLILFADPGGEKPETYRHRDEFSKWLVAHGMPEIITVREERFSLEQDCLDHKTLPSIVTGMRSCSDKFKIRPQDRYLAKWQPAIDAWERGETVTKLVGFDAGEPWRAKDYSSKRFTVRFPLIEWGWGREECIEAIKRHGLSVPPKSSCFFCPEMQEWEIVELGQKHPELLERAIQMERNAKGGALVQIAGLARTHSWEQVADFHGSQMTLDGSTLLPPRAERIPCVCFDGGASADTGGPA
jgi:hypothetical protein